MNLIKKLDAAWVARHSFLERCEQEETDCYRLFHGTVEGLSGVTVDRYGPEILVQSFHEPLSENDLDVIHAFYHQKFNFDPYWVYNDRGARDSRRSRVSEGRAGRTDTVETDVHLNFTAKELGVNYRVSARHQGEDPLLFLDLRATRRWLLEHATGKRVLNLFGYTCGAGVCASVAGAEQVWNVDFSKFALGFAQENYQLNHVATDRYRLIESDCFAALKQLAGIPIKPRMKKLSNGRRVKVALPEFPTLKPQQFDMVFLDPPKWAKSPLGTVDLVRDYQSLFKPALMVIKEQGILVACNNVAKVDCNEWVAMLKRCAEKNQRPIKEVEIIKPDEDFPTLDNRPPLKVAVCYL